MKNECFDLRDGVVGVVLTQGMVAYVDKDDLPKIENYRWHALRGKGKCYAVSNPKRPLPGKVQMHRLIVVDGSEVDHINGNSLDNRKANLRVCTRAQNVANRGKTIGRFGFKGVCCDKESGRWIARIKHNRRNYNLGRFDTAIEAANAYDKAAVALFGEFARCNIDVR